MADRRRRWWWAEASATLALAYPLVLTNLAGALIASTDVVLLGWAGPRTLAAGALGVNLINAFQFFGTGLVTAASPMISRAIGARPNNVRDVRAIVRQTLWAAVAIAIPIWLILWRTEAILIAFGQQPDLARDAARLVHPMMFGTLPLMFYFVLRAFVAALGRPGWSFLAGAIAVLTNAIGNYALIFGHFGLPALGLFGAGLGSAVSSSVMFAILAIVTLRHRRFRRYRLFAGWWRADWPMFGQVWRLGLPIAVTVALEITVFNAAVFLMGLLDTAELAAHAVAIQIAALCFMVPLGLSQAATVRVGIAFGRRDAIGVTRAGWTAFALTMAVMASTALLLVAAPRALVGLFLDLRDPTQARVVALAVQFLMVAALFQIVDGAQAVGAGMLRGLHDTAMPMLFAGVGYWVIGFGVAYLLAFRAGLGGVGVWLGLAAGLASVAVLMMARWARRARLGLVPAR